MDPHVVKCNKGLSPSTTVITNGVEEAVMPESWKELLNEEDQQDATSKSQEEVVDHK